MKIKRLLSYSILLLLLMNINCRTLPEPVAADIFQPLDDETVVNKWGTNYEKKAAIFQKIYNQHKNDGDFERQLVRFLGNNTDKHYWIGFYLDNSYYTDINNYTLALRVFKRGLDGLEPDDPERIPFLWTIGKKLYAHGDRDKSLPYLFEADFMSKRFPGYTPAWNSDAEYNEIISFIKSQTGKIHQIDR